MEHQTENKAAGSSRFGSFENQNALKMDLSYVQHYTPLLDLRILLGGCSRKKKQ